MKIQGWFCFCIFFLSVFLASASNGWAAGQKRPTPPQSPPPSAWVAPPAGKPFLIKVLNYNIQGLPVPTVDHGKYDKIAKILKNKRAAGTAPQIVAIQEAFHSNSVDLVKHSGYIQSVWGPKGRPMRVSSGLLILSDFKITEYSQISYEACEGSDCFANKGMQRAKLRIPLIGGAIELELFNTHLNADYSPEDKPKIQPVRINQIRQFQAQLLPVSDAGLVPSLFIGDFNFETDEVDHRFFRSITGAQDSRTVCLSGPASCVDLPSPHGGFTTAVDHQFFLPGSMNGKTVTLEPIKVENVFDADDTIEAYSDHAGLEVTYRVSQTGDK